MKPVYSNIEATQGLYAAGFCKIKLAAKEWISSVISPDFNTGKLTVPVTFFDGFNWLEFSAVPDTIEFSEKPKNNRGGSYYEVSLEADLNNIPPELLPVLESLRYHELVALVYDKRRRYKIIGNHETGLLFNFYNKEDASKQGGVQTVKITMEMDSEFAAIFYDI